MQIFVSGTWKTEKAIPYAEQARSLGREIADAGFDLACGPGTGIARHVIDGYREAEERGTVRYYLPSETAMAAVGEKVEPGADSIERTDLDYPMRNVLQIQRSDGLFVLTGGDGALEEILPAVIDYQIPVAAVTGTGTAVKALLALLEIYPEWTDLVSIGEDARSLTPVFFDRVQQTSRVRSTHSGE